MKPAAFPALRATRLLDQVRERIRYKHYSLRTEQADVQRVKVFVKWSGLRHPREMGGPEIEAFLTMLATERRVAASTHNQALSALLFLYREVLTVDLPWMKDIGRPRVHKRLPVVLTQREVRELLLQLDSTMWLVAAAAGCSARSTRCDRSARRRRNRNAVGQLDLHFQHFELVLFLEVDLDVFGLDRDVLGDHRHQLALQFGQVGRLRAAAARALVREDDLQPLLGDAGGLLLLAEQEREKRHRAHLAPPNRRLKKRKRLAAAS